MHIPVLLNQAIEALAIKPSGIYIDATFGRGGHSQLILSQLNSDGKLLVIDQDPTAIVYAKELASKDNRIIVCHGNFDKLKEFTDLNNILEIDGILFDLGVSSPQLDESDRGFSFNKDGPLDMRMDNSINSHCKFSAKDWVNKASAEEIADVLWRYGEERYSRRIAKAIVNSRLEEEITRTLQLAEIIKKSHPKWGKNKHPATKSFMAIRLFVNRELEVLEKALKQSLDLLKSDARLVVISFHSLEDRIVKSFMKLNSKSQFNDEVLAKLPITDQDPIYLAQKQVLRLKIVQKPMKAGIIEGDRNIRARSAILRVASKV